jgi:hypothetical protein
MSGLVFLMELGALSIASAMDVSPRLESVVPQSSTFKHPKSYSRQAIYLGAALEGRRIPINGIIPFSPDAGNSNALFVDNKNSSWGQRAGLNRPDHSTADIREGIWTHCSLNSARRFLMLNRVCWEQRQGFMHSLPWP